jgi:hypothetical protein
MKIGHFSSKSRISLQHIRREEEQSASMVECSTGGKDSLVSLEDKENLNAVVGGSSVVLEKSRKRLKPEEESRLSKKKPRIDGAVYEKEMEQSLKYNQPVSNNRSFFQVTGDPRARYATVIHRKISAGGEGQIEGLMSELLESLKVASSSELSSLETFSLDVECKPRRGTDVIGSNTSVDKVLGEIIKSCLCKMSNLQSFLIRCPVSAFTSLDSANFLVYLQSSCPLQHLEYSLPIHSDNIGKISTFFKLESLALTFPLSYLQLLRLAAGFGRDRDSSNQKYCLQHLNLSVSEDRGTIGFLINQLDRYPLKSLQIEMKPFLNWGSTRLGKESFKSLFAFVSRSRTLTKVVLSSNAITLEQATKIKKIGESRNIPFTLVLV